MITCVVVVVDDELEEDGEDVDEENQVRCLWCRGWRGFPHSRRSRLLQQGAQFTSLISS